MSPTESNGVRTIEFLPTAKKHALPANGTEDLWQWELDDPRDFNTTLKCAAAPQMILKAAAYSPLAYSMSEAWDYDYEQLKKEIPVTMTATAEDESISTPRKQKGP